MADSAPTDRPHSAAATLVFPGDSEMSVRCRAFDWAATPLGPANGWPVSLRTTVAMLLSARHPMILFWGPERVQLYNDAYVPTLGGADRHPAALGMRAADCWQGAVWEIVGPQIDEVVATGEPFVGREVPVHLERIPGAPIEERFVDLTYLPLVESDGTRTGVIAHGADVTAHVEARREVERLLAESEAARAAAERTAERLARLHRVGAALAGAATPEAVAEVVVREAPVAVGARTGAVTRLSADGSEFVLIAAHGLPESVRAAYGRFPNRPPSLHAEALAACGPRFLSLPDAAVADYPGLPGHWQAAGIAASATLPLVVGGEPFGVLSFGFATPKAFLPEERAFLVTVADQCAQALERARLFTAERRAREAAEAATRAQREFLATMSHELRTPLNAIGGYAELLELGIPGAVNDAQRQQLGRIQQSQRHLLGLVNEVLDLAKIDAGAVPVERAAVVVGDTVDAALALVRPQAAAKGLALGEGCAGQADAAYLGDEPRVRQILVNLLANAVKFTPSGGRVAVTCAIGAPPATLSAEGGPYLALRVEDTGVGVAPDQLSRIFEPFTQAAREPGPASNPYTRAVGGTGLGLTISRRFARLMGGDLTVESTPGSGSAFTLWLPMAERRSAPRVSDERAPASVGGTTDVARPHDGRADQRVDGGPTSLPARADPGLARLGEALLADAVSVVRAWGARLRADAAAPGSAVPAAHLDGQPFTDAELEDHAATFVIDVALALRTLAAGGADTPALLRDGTAILGTVAERHGAQRARLGWPAAALVRELDLLGEELDAALGRAARGDDEAATVRAHETVARLLAHGARVSLGGHRLALPEAARAR